MSDKKDNAQKIALLSIGTVAALGFVGYEVTTALAPPPARPASNPAPASVRPNADAPTDTSSNAPTQPASNTAAAIPNPGSDTVSVAPAAGSGSARVSAASEATLNPGADPFAPLPQSAMARTDGMNPALSGSVPTAGKAAAPQPSGLPPMKPNGYTTVGPNGLPLPMPVPAPKPAIPAAPELVGTLLGEKPSAVFRGEGSLITVQAGGKVGGWKVVSVHHGEVVLKTMGKTLHLGAGIPSSSSEDNLPAKTPGTSMVDTSPVSPASSAEISSPFAHVHDQKIEETSPVASAAASASQEQGSISSSSLASEVSSEEALAPLPDTALSADGQAIRSASLESGRMVALPTSETVSSFAKASRLSGQIVPPQKLISLSGKTAHFVSVAMTENYSLHGESPVPAKKIRHRHHHSHHRVHHTASHSQAMQLRTHHMTIYTSLSGS